MLIRAATPEDAQFLAWAILTATRSHLTRGWFDIALAQNETESLEFLAALTKTKSLSYWHYSRFLIAQESGLPVATLCACLAKDAYPATTTALLEAMAAVGMSTRVVEEVWRRGAYMFRCTIRPENESWLIENLATLPSCRGRGYLFSLVNHAIDRACERGVKQAQASTFIGNEPAERLFEKVGFHVARERRDPQFEATAGAPGLRQYVRLL